ncbi:hypothetical protein IW261DRAFT_1426089 [Armillaria novae-zelandiae]|uniref:Uncharacterized protein n=1 Tax=Armillaria novae-zelandiae TaxID=153914 RepID=A0AA39NNA2_9AGAR|nr:hypothetical protein IW261DRAFT_1426089 [Armillaria novae-zelandiae]
MTMVVEWSVAIDQCMTNSCTTVNIFVDATTQVFFHDSRKGNAYDNNVSINPTLVLSGYYIRKNGLWKPQTRQGPVRTEMHVFTSYSYTPGLKGYRCSGLFCYPFDCYRAYTSFFGQEALTNRAAPLGIMTKSGSNFSSGLEMMIPRIHDDEATVIVQRTTIIVAYCLILIITFWLITLMITLLTITTVIFRFQQKNEIIAVPIWTVFAGIQL